MTFGADATTAVSAEAGETGEAGEAEWPAMLAAAIAGEGIAAVFQPIVDLARATVVGYEALARFGDPRQTNPEEWFRAARSYGCSGELGAATITAAFAHRSSLPRNCFLAINIEPDVLSRQVVRDVLDRQDDLAGVVIELTEQTRIDSYLALEPYLERYKAAGAMIAVDDAGSGYAGLQHLNNVRPAIIKLDRQFVDGIDHDEAKRALVEMPTSRSRLGTFADRTDCWLLAEGIERPTGIADLESLAVGMTSNALQVNNDTPLADAARRAIVRPRHSRFQPLVCTDNAGR